MRLAFLIPTKDRHTTLARWLPSVLRAAGRCGATVLVCDQSARPFPAPDGVTVLHRPDLPGLPAARNVLIAACPAAEVVCFLDDDTEVAADFGLRLAAHAAGDPRAAGWGPVVELRPRRLRRLFRLAQFGALADVRRRLGRRQDAASDVLFGCAMAFRRDALGPVRFDARLRGYGLGEDLDFCRRLAARHGRRRPFRLCADLRAIHHNDTANRADPLARGHAKGRFLLWLARRHGGGNPATLGHLLLALAAACSGRGQEPASWRGVLAGILPWLR